MPTPLASQVQQVLPRTRDAYYKLVLAVGPARTGKTAMLTELAAHHSWPRLNVNLRLSERLLELTRRQRATRVASILDDMVRAEKSDVVLLDNMELAQDPLRLLQTLSRNRAIVAAWPGGFDGACLTYAEPGHPEARRYHTPQAVIVNAGDADQPDAGSLGEQMT
jgi:hypothetical protein